AGVYEMGVETLRAEQFTVESQEAVYTHTQTGSVTNPFSRRTCEAGIKREIYTAVAGWCNLATFFDCW
ncbi:hypothetical protein, partial [Nostoc sp.]